jgi:hypothetical protein
MKGKDSSKSKAASILGRLLGEDSTDATSFDDEDLMDAV